MSVRHAFHSMVAFGGLLLLGATPMLRAAEPPQPGNVSGALEWRLVGPFRGGWATMAAGVPDRPDTFYIGAAGGGVWKTVDAGRTWQSLFDRQPAAAIGAVAVAPSNPDVIYAGTGQVAARYDVAAGDGVYRSGDGGRHWQHVGLEQTRHIGRILIDPQHPDTLLVGALGHYYGPNHERGVFRSTDGGKSWRQTLFVDADTGVVDLAADPANPAIVYAAAWQVRNYPWLSYFQPNAGPGSGLYRSSDGGATWTRIGGHGWPTGSLGRIGLATASGGRVYAVINAAPNSGNVAHAASKNQGGLYRSDDSGATWQLVSQESWLENDYFSRITTDPSDRDRIYSAGQSIRRSDDGGRHWTIFKGAPGGDDYHFLWINPKDTQRMITASDQGAVVSVDGGRSWSSWYNQPTGQFYHLGADNQFPYWIYSGQQDSGTVGIASRSDYGSISYRDWRPVGGDERDYDLPDPADPNIVYGSGLGGRVSRWNRTTGVVQNVTPWPVNSYGQRPTDFKYHYTWITPIAFAAKPPYALYMGAQVLFRSTDHGQHWDVISPELNGKVAGAMHCDGNPTPQQAHDCGYGVIYSIAPSPRSNDEIWIGTDDGLIQLTRDGGKSWRNVTPKGLPVWAKISTLDVSALQAGTAYAAVDNHRQDDFRPHVWRTHDYGANWTDIAAGLPPTGFVDVVRADPAKAGLLYAGTETGVFVSLDDGAHWQPLQQNLPTAWVRDLLVHGNDLIAATQGRAIWVLDDVSSLRQTSAAIMREPAHLYTPAPAVRVRADENKDTPPPPETALGQNPPIGAVIDYRLAAAAKGPVTLDILDSKGQLVRHYASDDKPEKLDADRYFEKGWLRPGAPLSAAAGTHRFVWDLHYPRPPAIEYGYSIAATWDSDTPLTPGGALALPGTYQVVLKIDGKTYRVPLQVTADPREHVSESELAAGLAFSQRIGQTLQQVWQNYGDVQSVRKQLDALHEKLDKDGARQPLLSGVDALRAKTRPLVSGSGETSSNLHAMSDALAAIATDVEGADRAPTAGQQQALAEYESSLDKALAQWRTLRTTDLPKLNGQLHDAGIATIALPEPGRARADESEEPQDMP
ncbi:WD40/YVTN/BNR-like repeat-containing protein [Rhodanobacter terrae]|uniref:WD40/YVTN/BNR-like repeat-containing protein n=1 Tax=Rhodanobacter terrae TaxID=418647 RepID=A0ABW0SWR4_9GAMM